MSKIPYVLDVPEDASLLADCRGPCCTDGDGAPLFFDGGGLCCPDDLLDTVMEQLAAADDGFLEALGIEAGPPPPPPVQEPPAGRGGGAVELESGLPGDVGADGVAAMECGAPDFCRGLFPFPMDAGSGGGFQACGDGAPLLPAHEVGGFSPLADAGLHGGLHAFGGGAPQLTAHDLCSFSPVDMVLTDAGGGVHASGDPAPQLPAAHDVDTVPMDAGTAGGLHAFCNAAPQLPPHDACGLLPVDMVLSDDMGSDGGVHAFGDSAPQLPPHGAPVSLPARAAPVVLSASSADTTTVSSAGCQPSTNREAEWRPPIFPLPLDFVAPRKKRNRPANRRNNQSWSPHFLLDAARNNPSSTSGNEGEHGGVVRRRPVPRPRNRQARRVCSHCERSDTPQWRAGPEGPGTLCNACGIRHAMGKLLDEYRPSTSPSFQSDKHSNRHRKVMKLREQKAKKEPPKLMDAKTSGPIAGAHMSDETCQ